MITVHKNNISLRPTVNTCGWVTYELGKQVAKQLGQSSEKSTLEKMFGLSEHKIYVATFL